MPLRGVAEGRSEYTAWARDPTRRIGWGLPFFDEPTFGGIGRGEVCLVTARSYVGKTQLMLNVVRANADVPALIFSLEMQWRFLVVRLAAMTYGVATNVVEAETKKGIDPEVLLRLEADYPFLLCDDTPGVGFKAMDRTFEDATERLGGYKPKLVCLDYMELINQPGISAVENVPKVARSLKDWARKHDTSLLVLHQVGRTSGDSGAEPLDIKSGKLGGEEAADYVVGAYAPRLRKGITREEYDGVKDQLFLQLLKNRSGRADGVGVKHRFDQTSLRITEWNDQPWLKRPEPLAMAPVDDPWVRMLGTYDEDLGVWVQEEEA